MVLLLQPLKTQTQTSRMVTKTRSVCLPLTSTLTAPANPSRSVQSRATPVLATPLPVHPSASSQSLPTSQTSTQSAPTPLTAKDSSPQCALLTATHTPTPTPPLPGTTDCLLSAQSLATVAIHSTELNLQCHVLTSAISTTTQPFEQTTLAFTPASQTSPIARAWLWVTT